MIKSGNIIYLGKAQPEGGSGGGGGSATIQPLSITPATTQQTISASSSVDGYAPITVAAVENVSASNIKSGVTICGVEGSVVELAGETQEVELTSATATTFTPSTGKNGITSIQVTPKRQFKFVNPTTSQQSITADSGYCGLSSVIVRSISSDLDSNFQNYNIKSGVTIFGKTGTYEGVQPSGTINITTNGNYQDVSNYKYANVNVPDKTTIGVKLDNLIKTYDSGSSHTIIDTNNDDRISANIDTTGYDTISSYALRYGFAGKTIVNGDFSSITAVSTESCNGIFMDSTFGKYSPANTVTIDFSSLVNAGSSTFDKKVFYRAFYGAKRASENVTLVINFSSLKYICNTGFKQAFSIDNYGYMEYSPYLFSNRDIVFQSLENVEYEGLCEAFAYRKVDSISFLSLKSSNFTQEANRPFKDMILGNTNCTIHFPSNLQSVIGSWTDVTNGFGGTNTTVLFDLPATDAPNYGGGGTSGGD